jgi:hypothetical protein
MTHVLLYSLAKGELVHQTELDASINRVLISDSFFLAVMITINVASYLLELKEVTVAL